MSLKSRLLKNRESKTVTSAQTEFDLIAYFKKNKDFQKLTAYSYDAVYAEKNGIKTLVPISFVSEEAYLAEIERISKLYELDENDLKVKSRNGISVKILKPPVVENNPVIFLSRQKNINYQDYFTSKVVSSEISSYLRECISQKANIFVTGNHDVEKNDILNFLLQLSDENDCNLIYDPSGKLLSDNQCNIKISEELFNNIGKMEYDSIFCSDINNDDLVKIFRYIILGHKGFNVSLSLNKDTEITEALRNLVLLNNNNLFEENADFLTSSCVDVVIVTDNNAYGNIYISKISEITTGAKKTIVLKDIFTGNSSGVHTSTGNSSKFYNKVNSKRFLKEYLEEGHIHSYISGHTSDVIPVEKNKTNRLKEKLKKLKKEKVWEAPILNVQEQTEEIPEQEIVYSEPAEEIEDIFTAEEATEDSAEIILEHPEETETQKTQEDLDREDIINNTLFNSSAIPNILADNDEEENKESVKTDETNETNEAEVPEEITTEEEQEDFDAILKATEKEMEITEKYSQSLEPQIIEEPQLFSEIEDDNDNKFGLDDLEDI